MSAVTGQGEPVRGAGPRPGADGAALPREPGARPAQLDRLRGPGDHPALQPGLHALLPLRELRARQGPPARGGLPADRRDPEQFGAPTAVQITGGDPTLRKREELVAIVRRTRELGHASDAHDQRHQGDPRPARGARRRRLERRRLPRGPDPGAQGLRDREGPERRFGEEYIERARGIPIAVIFNTTVCRDNFDEIPDLIRFFRRHADVVGMASFQLQADTGRGVLRERDRVISLETVRRQIAAGAETDISLGHGPDRAPGVPPDRDHLAANGNLYDLNDDPAFFNRFLSDFQHVMLDRRQPARAVRALARRKRAAPAPLAPRGRPLLRAASSGRCAATSSPPAAASTSSPSSCRTSWTPSALDAGAHRTPAPSWS